MNINPVLKNVNPKTKEGRIYILVDLYTKDLRQQIFFKTDWKVLKSEFSNNKIVGKTLRVKKINDSLFEEIIYIKKLIIELEEKGININKDSLVKARNESNQIEKSIGEYFKEFKKKYEDSNNIPISIKIQTLIGHFTEFAKSKNYYSYSIDQNFIDSFANHLLIKKGLHPNTVHRHFKNIRTFFNYLEQNHKVVIEKNLKYPSQVKTEKTFLTKEEIKLLIDYEPKTKKLVNVKKLMIIQIYTGLRYSDLRRLNSTHIQGLVIRMQMQKVTDSILIPIAPELNEVLKSINYTVKNIIISNQKYNDYIKEICELAKINTLVEITQYNKGLKFFVKKPKFDLMANHNLRNTFVTIAVQSKMDLNMIMKITGHKKISTLQLYAKSVEDYVSVDYVNFTNFLNG